MAAEFAIDIVLCNRIRLQGFRHPPVWIGFPDRAFQSVLVHQTEHFFVVHADAHSHKPHADPAVTFGIATEIISCFDARKSPEVLLFPPDPGRCRTDPPVITGTGHPGQFTEFFDIERRPGLDLLPDQSKSIPDTRIYFLSV